MVDHMDAPPRQGEVAKGLVGGISTIITIQTGCSGVLLVGEPGIWSLKQIHNMTVPGSKLERCGD